MLYVSIGGIQAIAHLPFLPPSSSGSQKLHPGWAWPRRWASLTPQLQSKLTLSHSRDNHQHSSFPPATSWRGKIPGECGWGAALFYSAPNHRTETLPHTGKVENICIKMAFTLARSQETGAMMGEASAEIQRLVPCPGPRTVAHRVCPGGEAAHGKRKLCSSS